MIFSTHFCSFIYSFSKYLSTCYLPGTVLNSLSHGAYILVEETEDAQANIKVPGTYMHYAKNGIEK